MLYICISACGYVYGSSTNENASRLNYWPEYLCESVDSFRVYRYENIPEKLQDDLLKHGTGEQVFSDGYTAMQSLKFFKGVKVAEYKSEYSVIDL